MLRAFENKVPMKILGTKRDDNRRGWRKLHNAELHILYSSPNVITNLKLRQLRWVRYTAHMKPSRN